MDSLDEQNFGSLLSLVGLVYNGYTERGERGEGERSEREGETRGFLEEKWVWGCAAPPEVATNRSINLILPASNYSSTSKELSPDTRIIYSVFSSTRTFLKKKSVDDWANLFHIILVCFITKYLWLHVWEANTCFTDCFCFLIPCGYNRSKKKILNTLISIVSTCLQYLENKLSPRLLLGL